MRLRYLSNRIGDKISKAKIIHVVLFIGVLFLFGCMCDHFIEANYLQYLPR